MVNKTMVKLAMLEVEYYEILREEEALAKKKERIITYMEELNNDYMHEEDIL